MVLLELKEEGERETVKPGAGGGGGGGGGGDWMGRLSLRMGLGA